MEYGILVALNENRDFQIVGAVSSVEEAKELIRNYFTVGVNAYWMPPDSFQIHRRGVTGGYTHIEVVSA